MTHALPDTAPGFDQPIAVLKHCHDRIRKQLATLEKLLPHLASHGADQQARDAATAVIKYFDKAAPLHHEDEELHVFPAVLAQGDGALTSAVKQLMDQHRQMERHWVGLRAALASLGACEMPQQQTFESLQKEAVVAFVALYDAHILLEEDLVYPAANKHLDQVMKNAMGADMKRRRGAKSAD